MESRETNRKFKGEEKKCNERGGSCGLVGVGKVGGVPAWGIRRAEGKKKKFVWGGGFAFILSGKK